MARLKNIKYIKKRSSLSYLGTTLVSSPHLTSWWASSMALMSVVPDLGTPPMKMSGVSRSYSNMVPSDPTMDVLREACKTFGAPPEDEESLQPQAPPPPRPLLERWYRR